MNDKTKRQICKECGATFYSSRWDADLCSPKCRKRHSRRMSQKSAGQ